MAPKIKASDLMADGQGEIIEDEPQAISAADLMAEGGEVLDDEAEGPNASIGDLKLTLDAGQKAAARKALANQGEFKGGTGALNAAALNSSLLGGLPQVAAANDAMDELGGYDGPGEVTDLSSAFKRLGSKFLSNMRANWEFAKHPIDTTKKFGDKYAEQVSKYREGLRAKSEEYPKETFAGSVALGLLSNPTSVAQAAIPAVAQGFLGSETISQGDTSPESLKRTAASTALSGTMGALGYKVPLAGAGLALGSAAFGDKIGMSESDREQALYSGLMGTAGGLMSAVSNAKNNRSVAAGKERSRAESEIASLLVDDDHAAASKLDKVFSKQAEQDRADLVDKTQGAVDKAISEKAPVEKAFKKALDKEGRALRRAMTKRLGEEGHAQATAAKESDDALVEAFQAEERALAKTGTGDAKPDLDAQIDGILGNKVKEGFQFMRTKDPMALKFGPEAEAGYAAIKPDYEAKGNEVLAEFAGGKDAVREAIRAKILAEAAEGQNVVSLGDRTTISVPSKERLAAAMGGGPVRGAGELISKPKAAPDVGDEKFWKLAKEVGINLGTEDDLLSARAHDLVPGAPTDKTPASGRWAEIAKETGANRYEFGGNDLDAIIKQKPNTEGTVGARPHNSIPGANPQGQGTGLYDVKNPDHMESVAGGVMPKAKFFPEDPKPLDWGEINLQPEMPGPMGDDFPAWNVGTPKPPDMKGRVEEYVRANLSKDAKKFTSPSAIVKAHASNAMAKALGGDVKSVVPPSVRYALYGKVEKALAQDPAFAQTFGPMLATALQRGGANSRDAVIGWLMDNEPRFVRMLQGSSGGGSDNKATKAGE